MCADPASLKTTSVTTETSASSMAAVDTFQSLVDPADAPMTLVACFQEILRYLPSATGNDNDTYVSLAEREERQTCCLSRLAKSS